MSILIKELKICSASKFHQTFIVYFVVVACSLILGNCSPSCMDGKGDKSIKITWDSSRSYDVSTVSGGGHKVYYNSTSSISKTNSAIVDIPASTSGVSGTISKLHGGCTYYIRVGAYSNLNPAGSNLSAERSIKIP